MSELGERIVAFARAERPGTLIEFPLRDGDYAQLRQCVRSLPLGLGWKQSDNACVALFAVRVAARADVDQHSFREAFFDGLGRVRDDRQWDDFYGPAIESFLRRAFGHQPFYGPYRYVGPVYRHAGITARDIGAYAVFLGEVLDLSPALRHDAYTSRARLWGGRIGPFLQSSAGFDFSRATAKFLADHQHFRQPVEWLESLVGYPKSFWPNFLSAFQGKAPKPTATPPPPRLALDPDEGKLVIRFDAAFVTRGSYFVEGRPVRYVERVVSGPSDRAYGTGSVVSGTPHVVEPWWTPSMGGCALFRESDGALLLAACSQADAKELPPGQYVVVGSPEVLSRVEGHDYGYLTPPAEESDCLCLVRQFTLEPGGEVSALGLRADTHAPAPEVVFAYAAPEGVFFGALPKLRVTHWPERGAFRLVCDTGAKRFVLPVTPGSSLLSLDVPCPSSGAIRVEYQGIDYAQRNLPTLSYTLLPAALRPPARADDVGPHDRARVSLPLVEQWHVADPDNATQVTSGVWDVPAGTGLWKPVLAGPEGFHATVPISIPVFRLELGTSLASPVLCAEDWKELRETPITLQGRKWQQARVVVSSGQNQHVLLDVQMRPRAELTAAADGHESGGWSGSIGSCLDSLQSCRLAIGRLVVIGPKNRQLRQGLAWLSPQQWAALLNPFGTHSLELPPDWVECLREAAPELAEDLQSLLNTLDSPQSALRLASIEQHAAPLLPAAAGLCLLAGLIDGSSSDRSLSQLWDLWRGRDTAAGDPLEQFFQWWEQGDDQLPQWSLGWSRWQQRVEERRAARWLELHPAQVIRQFRDAVLADERDAAPLAGRLGHDNLFQGTRRLFRALTRVGEPRNHGLVGAQHMLSQAFDESRGAVAVEDRLVSSAAAILDALARFESGLVLSEEALARLQDCILPPFQPALNDLREKAGLLPGQRCAGVTLNDFMPPPAAVEE